MLTDLILAVIGEHGSGGCRGRTRLQKLVYFLRKPMGVQVIYQPHYYGPYSAEVAGAVQSLVAEGLVNEASGPSSREGPFERILYTYTLECDGQALVAAWQSRMPHEAERLTNVYRELELASQGIDILAVASKIHHIVSRGPVRRDELIARAAGLGWDVDESEKEKAVDFLMRHHLVKEVSEPSC